MASTSATTTKIGTSNEQPLRPLWVSLLAGPVLYMVYFFVGYMLAEAACAVDFWQSPVLNVPGWILVEIGLTLLTVVSILLAGRQAWHTWQRTQHQAVEESSIRFMAFGTLFFVPLFVFVTLVTGIALIVLQPCSWI